MQAAFAQAGEGRARKRRAIDAPPRGSVYVDGGVMRAAAFRLISIGLDVLQ